MRYRWIGILIIFSVFWTDLYSQTTSIKAKMIWADYFLNVKLNSKFRFYGQAGYRNLITNGNWQQFMIRPCLDYTISKKVGIHGGILSSYSFSDEEDNFVEIVSYLLLNILMRKIDGYLVQIEDQSVKRGYQNSEVILPCAVKSRLKMNYYVQNN